MPKIERDFHLSKMNRDMDERVLPDGQYRKPSDNSKIKELLPDFKFTPLDKAIEETVEWFMDNYPANTRIGKSCTYSVH